MRSTWLALAALGGVAFGCSSTDASGGGNESSGGAGGWLMGEEPTATPQEAEVPDAKTPTPPNGTGGSAGSGPTGGSGGAGLGENLATVCPGYDKTKYSHTLIASAADPGNTASAQRARESILGGEPPVPGSVRLTDFVNLFAWSAASNNTTADAVGGKVELRTRSIEGQKIATQFDLFVGVTAGKVARPRVVLTLLVDATLTAKALDKTKAVIEGLGKGLLPNDHVTLMSADPTLPVVEQDATVDGIPGLAEQLATGSGTLGARLPEALGHAAKFPAGTWNRVVVISDGEENWQEIDFSKVEAAATASKIFTTTIGVSGDAGYGEPTLFRLSHAGRGRYLYADASIATLVAERFEEIFGLARDKVRVRVDLPSYMYSLDPEPVGGGGVPRDKYLAPGETARFLFHVATCAELAIQDSTLGMLENLTVSVDSETLQGQPQSTTLKSQIMKKYLGVFDNPELDKMAGIQAFVDALKYPEKNRFTAATEQLSALTAAPGPELLSLLGQHPANKP